MSITEEKEITSSHDLLMTKKIHIAEMDENTKYVSTRFHSP